MKKYLCKETEPCEFKGYTGEFVLEAETLAIAKLKAQAYDARVVREVTNENSTS